MLSFRDSSWYQSGNSGRVRDRQRQRQRERESAGAAARAVAPVPPFLSSPGGRRGQRLRG